MANLRDLIHREIRNTALPYDRSLSVTDEALAWVDGQNLLTSIAGFVERRPGFNTVFANVTAGETIRSLYLWRIPNDAFFLMAAASSGSNSTTVVKTYKMKIGTDTDLVQLDTKTGSLFVPLAIPPFVAYGGTVFIGAPNPKKYAGSGTTQTNWGFGSPGSAPSTAQAAGTLNAVVGYRYVSCFLNSGTGHLSSPSPVSVSTDPFTSKQVTVTSITTVDTQVDKIAFYRTTDGGEGVFFELPNSPVTLPTNSIVDTAEDASLKSNVAPKEGFNDPPAGGGQGVAPTGIYMAVEFSNRIWGVETVLSLGNKLWFSGWEEIDDGVEQESFPPQNFFLFPSEITGLAVAGESETARFLVFTAGKIFKVTGDSIDILASIPLFAGLGCRNWKAIAPVGKAVAWLDTSSTVRVTDGFTEMDISKPIWADIAGIDHAKASLCYHNDNKRNWLLLANGVDKIWVYDLMTQRWMPPWTVGAVTAMVSGEKASATKTLLVAKGTKVLELTPSTYLDDAANYSAFGVLGPYSLAPSLAASNLEYVRIERNTVALTTVKQLPDDDPASGTFIELTTKITPPLRVQGTALLEEWYYSRTPAARRMAVRFDWGGASTNFKLYTIGFVSRECQRI